MCGIVALFGGEKISERVLQGLQHLEYRGYDSWGIGVLTKEGIILEKRVGKISEAVLQEDFPEGLVAFGHTRWATHGGVTENNAHPHCSADQKVSVVMNGIIENFLELRAELQGRGYLFLSETDTEVLPHLISDALSRGKDLLHAAQEASEKCDGRFSFAVIQAENEEIVAIRRGSPLILGVGNAGEFFLASDIPAFLPWTSVVQYLDDGEALSLSSAGAHFFDISSLNPKEKRKILLDVAPESVEKGEHEHFMMKEIFEQKETLYRALQQDDEEILRIAEAIRKAKGTFLIGCGTAHKVASVGEYFFAKIAKRHVNVVVSSEFPLFHNFLQPESLVIAISQSGETADVIEAIQAAQEAGSRVLSLVNAENSTVARLSDFSLKIRAGIEKAVASTKAATSQIALLLLLAFATAGRLQEGKRFLSDTASLVNDLLNPRFPEFVGRIAERICSHRSIFIIGKGENFPLAREAAIKIQEVSYIHAEGFASGELKHGPLAMIEEGTPVLVLVSDDPQQQREIMSSAMEIKARGGNIIGISPEPFVVFDQWIRVPHAGIASPLVNLIPVQILAYRLAIECGANPDMPRNLAKSVTVK